MPSFSNKKQLRFQITLGTDKFNEAGDDQITLQGYRAEVDIENAGWLQMGMMRAKIYGMAESDMYKATMYPFRIGPLQNTIIVYAVDGDSESIVFAGNIVQSWGNFSSVPDVYLEIQAQAAFSSAITAVKPRSFKGGADVAEVMRSISDSMGRIFTNHGVSVKLSNVYLANTDLEQARQLARDSNIELVIDGLDFDILPKGQTKGSFSPEISKDNGMIGYPRYDGTYMTFETLYNPAIIPLGRIKMQTSFLPALGEWAVISMQHKLESETPGGVWMTSVICASPSVVAGVRR